MPIIPVEKLTKSAADKKPGAKLATCTGESRLHSQNMTGHEFTGQLRVTMPVEQPMRTALKRLGLTPTQAMRRPGSTVAMNRALVLGGIDGPETVLREGDTGTVLDAFAERGMIPVRFVDDRGRDLDVAVYLNYLSLLNVGKST